MIEKRSLQPSVEACNKTKTDGAAPRQGLQACAVPRAQCGRVARSLKLDVIAKYCCAFFPPARQ